MGVRPLVARSAAGGDQLARDFISGRTGSNSTSKALVRINFRYQQQPAVIPTEHSFIMRRGILSALFIQSRG